MNWLRIYLAGAVATAVGSWAADRTAEKHQRLPLSCHLLLAIAWPPFLAFLGCATLASRRRTRAESSAVD